MGRVDLLVLSELAAVGAAHHPGAGLVLAKHALHGVRDFAHRASERGTAVTQLFYFNRQRRLKGERNKTSVARV